MMRTEVRITIDHHERDFQKVIDVLCSTEVTLEMLEVCKVLASNIPCGVEARVNEWSLAHVSRYDKEG